MRHHSELYLARFLCLSLAVAAYAAPPGLAKDIQGKENMDSLRLNLGAGDEPLEGYVSIDRKDGKEAYPLDGIEDDSVEEIYASHLLEHFSHRDINAVLQHWVRKLKPGGRLRLAVPDFAWIAKNYLDGEPINTMGYVMGGHLTEDDKHGAVFDREMLIDILVMSGLERIGLWESPYDDDSSMPLSLNLQGYKPASTTQRPSDTIAILSAPRFGPIMHMRCVVTAFQPLGIPYEVGQGAYWHQVLSEQVEKALTNPAIRFIITCDYDTVFSRDDVMELWRLANAIEDAHAICPMQSRRGTEHILAGILDEEGNPKSKLAIAEKARLLTRVSTGHFGLTIFKAEALRKAPRPWFVATPSPEDRWNQGRTDADIVFWHQWRKAGLRLYLAHRVVVGHIEECIKWPGRDYKPVYQEFGDYVERGIPAEVERVG